MTEKKLASALAELVLRMVIKDGDVLRLNPRAPAAFAAALDALFADESFDPRAEIDSVLRLAHTMQTSRQPVAADGILQLLAEHDRALALLGMGNRTNAHAGKKQFAQFSGEDDKLSAPSVGQAAPLGSIKASSFIDTGRDVRSRKPVAKPVPPKQLRPPPKNALRP